MMNEFSMQVLFRLGVASAFLAMSTIVAVGLLTVVRCRSAFIHRATWCLVLLQGVLVVELPITVPWNYRATSNGTVGDEFGQNWNQFNAVTQVHAQGSMSASPMAASDYSPVLDWDWASILLVVWVSGILFILIRWATEYWRFIQSVASEECDIDDWCWEWAEVATDSNITTPLPLHVSRSVGPMLCRWPTGYRIIVPHVLWRNLTRQQRQAILQHELAHFERRDIPKTFVANCLAMAHWFNPLAWVAVRRFEDSIEWACDNAVETGTLESAASYAKALLAIGEHSRQSTAWTSGIGGGGLSARIRRVLSTESRRDSRIKIGLVISVLTGLLLSHLVRVDLVAQEPEQSANEQRIVSQSFFVVPVNTEFQKWRLQSEDVVAFASIDGTTFVDLSFRTSLIRYSRISLSAFQVA